MQFKLRELPAIFAALVFIGCGLAFTASAQAPEEEWSRTIGDSSSDESGASVQQTSDGGYIITGSTQSYGPSDVFLIKTDADGNTQWVKTFDGSFDDSSRGAGGASVQQTSDGGYIITGSTSSNRGEVLLIKTDADGNTQWVKTFGGSFDDSSRRAGGASVQQTSDGGYIITGFISSNGGDVLLIKTDADGKQQWVKTFGRSETFAGSARDEGQSVQQTSDGGYIITGSTSSNRGEVLLIKTDADGKQQWVKTFGDSSSDDYSFSYYSGASVQQTSDGGYIITGSTSSNDVLLIKTDGDGNKQWDKAFGDSSDDSGASVQQTSDGGYIITGSTEPYRSSSDLWLIKTDVDGNTQWDKTFGGSSDDSGASVQQTSDGGYIITGSTNSYGAYGAAQSDIWLIKIDADGNE